MYAVEVLNLNKKFTYKKKIIKKNGKKSLFKSEKITKNAVDNVSFAIKEGEAVAFIGPNGAGKSTTIKMLCGILYPTEGKIKVLGMDPTKERVKLSYKIGTVFGQKEQLWIHLTPMQNFKFFGSIYDIQKQELMQRIEELSTLFEIKEYINQPVKSLSLGQRMKCEMVASLLHQPKMLFFDEPTIGLDPIAKETLRNLIKKINKELKTTILFTSHDVGDIEEVCSRVIIINNGKVVLDDTMESLKHYLNKKIVEINLKESVVFPEKKGIKILSDKDTFYKLEVDLNEATMDEMMKMFDVANLQDISISSVPLEEIIKDIYRQK